VPYNPGWDCQPGGIGIGAAVVLERSREEGVVIAIAPPGLAPAGFSAAQWSPVARYVVQCRRRRVLLLRSQVIVVCR
jgi:hypothetical protein